MTTAVDPVASALRMHCVTSSCNTLMLLNSVLQPCRTASPHHLAHQPPAEELTRSTCKRHGWPELGPVLCSWETPVMPPLCALCGVHMLRASLHPCCARV